MAFIAHYVEDGVMRHVILDIVDVKQVRISLVVCFHCN